MQPPLAFDPHPTHRPPEPTPDVVLVCTTDGHVRWATGGVDALLGRPADDLRDVELSTLVHPDDRAALGADLLGALRVLGRGHRAAPVLRFARFDGGWTPLRITASDLRAAEGGEGEDPDGAAPAGGVVGVVVVSGFDFATVPVSPPPVDGHRVILERIARGAPVLGTLEGVAVDLSRTLGHLPVVITMSAPGGALQQRSTGVPTDVLDVLDRTAVVRPRGEGDDGGAAPAGSGVVRRAPGWSAVVDAASGGGWRGCWAVDVASSAGAVARLVALVPDARPPTPAEDAVVARAADLVGVALAREAVRMKLDEERHLDPLTGLPNRHRLVQEARAALDAAAARPGAGVALLSCDLDGFRQVNDSLGPEAGDRVLREVARRFARAVRPDDLVARVGGNDFAVLCRDVTSVAEVRGVAERLGRSLRNPIDLEEGPVVVTTTIGIARGVPGTDAALLLRDADLARREAARRGRGGRVVFEPALLERVTTEHEIEGALRAALAREELRLVYQPIVSLVDGALVGCEALLRWDLPGRGAVAPDQFVPVATTSGLILPLGRWAIARAIADAVTWPDVPVSVNVAAAQLADAHLVDYVVDVLDRVGLPPERLVLEVTESELAAEPVPSADVLRRFAALGIGLAIDDFGTGFASLDYLRRYAMAHTLKIDASYVRGLTDLSGPDLPIVSATLLLARNLGFGTVAEGVETREQRDILRQLGCDRGQGLLFSDAIGAAEVRALVGARAASRAATRPA